MKAFIKHKKTPDQVLFDILSYGLPFIFGMMCLIPFYLIFISSFASDSALLRNGYQLIPEEFSLASYQWVFRTPQRIFFAYRNTILVTVIGTTIAILMATMTGYVLARRDFPWRNGFSLFFFFTTLFNGGLVPWYILCTQYLGFKNKFISLILPLVFPVWNMIIAKNYMRGIPYEILESAKVDGANDILIFFRLVLPVAKPLIATLGLFSALSYWNDWYNCMLFVTDKNKQNLQYFLQEMLGSIEALKQLIAQGESSVLDNVTLPQAGIKMAMTCVVVGPIIFLYPMIQKYFIKGLTIGAVKG